MIAAVPASGLDMQPRAVDWAAQLLHPAPATDLLLSGADVRQVSVAQVLLQPRRLGVTGARLEVYAGSL